MTTETNAERLEQVQSLLNAIGEMGDGKGQHGKDLKLLEWLIQQTARVQELEDELTGWQTGQNMTSNHYNKIRKLNIKNFALEQALEEILELSKHDAVSRYLDKCYVVASNALENNK